MQHKSKSLTLVLASSSSSIINYSILDKPITGFTFSWFLQDTVETIRQNSDLVEEDIVFVVDNAKPHKSRVVQ